MGNEPASILVDSVISGVDIVSRLISLRVLRQTAADEAGAALDTWRGDRARWWSALEAHSSDVTELPLVALQRRFALLPEELDLLLLALAPQTNPDFLDRLAEARPQFRFRGLDLELALSLVFHTPRDQLLGRALLSHSGRLVRFGFVQLAPIGFGTSPHELEVRPTDSLANFVLGRPWLSGVVSQFCDLVAPVHAWDTVALAPASKQLVWDLVAASGSLRDNLQAWGYSHVMPRGRSLTLLFAGPPGTGKTALAHAIAHRLGRPLLVIHTSKLLATPNGIHEVLADAFRIATLSGSVILFDDCESLLDERNARLFAIIETLDSNDGVIIFTTNDAPSIDFAMTRRIVFRLDFEAPDSLLRHQIWETHLPPGVPVGPDVDIEALAAAYEFTGAKIRNAVLVALARMTTRASTQLTMRDLREAAETQLAARFDDFAVRGGTAHRLEALVLAPEPMAEVREVLTACRIRETVMSRWGFAERVSTGRGICVLFDGSPGTGKTYTAEILANELHLPLYRVHIPNVVSKWVGETERNISEIFARARSARAILLFDEADSLFSRRTAEVGSANDRYANMEINLLLQEIERYDGISVLTTNLFGSLDEALRRRIQFRVTFPEPGPEDRARIWRGLLPTRAELSDDIDVDALGRRFELVGGYIKNAVLRAAYRACGESVAIAQRHLVDAATAESRAQGKVVRLETAVGTRAPGPAALKGTSNGRPAGK